MGQRPERRRQAPIAQDQISGGVTCPRCGGATPHYGSCPTCSYRLPVPPVPPAHGSSLSPQAQPG